MHKLIRFMHSFVNIIIKCLVVKMFKRKFVGYFSSPKCIFLNQIFFNMNTKITLIKSLVFLFILITSDIIIAQTGWSIDQTFTPKIVKTRDFFFRINKSNDKYYFAQNLDRKVLRRMSEQGTVDDNYSLETNGNIIAITQAQNGKTYIGGDFTSASNVFAPKIIRLNSDGTRDLSFLPDTNSQGVHSLYELPDGKILVGREGSIQRLNSDGTLDTSFATVTTNSIVQTFSILPNNKILVGGYFTTVNGSTKNRIVMLNSDGTVDNSFVVGTGFDHDVYIIKQANDGSFFIGGKFTTFKGSVVNRMAKISATGDLDTTFHNNNSGFNDEIWTIEFMDDNKPLIGGLFTSYNGIENNSIVKLNFDATVDSTFDTGVADSNGYVYKIIINSSNNIFVSGTFLKYKNTLTNQAFIANNNGSINNSFYFDDRFCMPGFSLINNNGGLGNYGTDNLDGFVNYPFARQSDGKILLGNIYYENKFYPMLRLNPDGSRDTSFIFDVSALPADFIVMDIQYIIVRPNGKIICSAVTGKYGIFNGNKKFKGLFQLNVDGSLDITFDTGHIDLLNNSTEYFNFGGAAYPSITLQEDGKIILFINQPYSYKGYDATGAGAIRILENGNIDITFQNLPATFSKNNIELLYMPNGKILVYCKRCTTGGGSGYGVYIGGTIGVALLNNNGTLDHRFQNLILPAYIGKIIPIENNLLFCVSSTTTAQTNAVFINQNGSIITNFSNLYNSSIPLYRRGVLDARKNGNKFYFMINKGWSDLTGSGGINSFNVNPNYNYADYDYTIVRTNEDGTLDNTFSEITIPAYEKHFTNAYHSALSRSPYNLHIEFSEPNQLYIHGPYMNFNNEIHYGFNRIIVDNNLSIANQGNERTNDIQVYPNPSNSFIILQRKQNANEIFNYKVYDLTGRVVLKGTSAFNEKINTESLTRGNYIIQVETASGEKTSLKVVKG